MNRKLPGLCQHAGEGVPGCQTVADTEATLDLGDGMTIYYCGRCGPGARKMAAALMEAMKDPAFTTYFERAVDEAERDCDEQCEN